MKRTLLYLLVILSLGSASCRKEGQASDKSKQAEQALLATQTAWLNGEEITSDSLINIAVTYYAKQGNPKEKTTVYLYQGRVRECMQKDMEAIISYKKAEEHMQTVSNRELRFWVYTALGNLNFEYAHYELAMSYYRYALELKLSGSAWHTMMKKGYYDKKGPCKQYTESLLQLVERMDFASQEKVYLQQALRSKDNGNWEEVLSYLHKALACTSIPENRYRIYAEIAYAYQQEKKYVEADSLYTEALKSSSRTLKANIYKDIYNYHSTTKEKEKAYEALQKYVRELEHLYTSESRSDLLEIEKEYDTTVLKRENEAYQRKWILGLLSATAIICSLAIFAWGLWKFFRQQKAELLHSYKKESSALQTRIDTLQEQMEESEGETLHLQEQISTLEAEKHEKDIRIHQLEVTSRAKRVALSPETAEAVQFYLNLIERRNATYRPAEDRFKLAHWLNISRNRWAERLVSLYPTLTNGEKDICYLFAIGFSFDEMADLLQIQPRSVDRVVYRICKKMGLDQGNKEDFAKQLKHLNTQP